jgi:hypothetical protein
MWMQHLETSQEKNQLCECVLLSATAFLILSAVYTRKVKMCERGFWRWQTLISCCERQDLIIFLLAKHNSFTSLFLSLVWYIQKDFSFSVLSYYYKVWFCKIYKWTGTFSCLCWWCETVSELVPSVGVLFIPQMMYEYGEPRWNDIDRKTKDRHGCDRNLEQDMINYFICVYVKLYV